MNYIIVLTFLLVYNLFDTSLGYSHTSPLYTHFTYVFQHAGIVHLIANSISFISFSNLLGKVTNAFYYPYLIAVLASFASEYDKPTVGASGMDYAMIGMVLAYACKGDKIKIVDKRKFALMVGLICISIGLGFITGSNNAIHIYSLLIGFIVVYL